MLNCTNHIGSSTTLLIAGPASTLVIFLGLIGNGYCIRVLSRISINTSMLVSLSGLAVWDMLLLISALLHHSLWATLFALDLYKLPWDIFTVSLNGIHECAHVTSTWMLMDVSAERFFAVTQPFRFMPRRKDDMRRKSYAKAVASIIRMPLTLTVIACLLTLPCSFEYKLEPCNKDGSIYRQRRPTALLNSSLYRMIYRTLILSVLKTFGPFVLIALLTVYTVKRMRESMQGRATILMEQGQDSLFLSDKDKTKSLRTISMLLLGKFLLLRCWPTGVDVGTALWGWLGEELIKEEDVAPRVAHFFLLLNSATNAFVFVVLKSAFESRRNRRIRMRQRRMVAKHAEQVLSISRLFAGDIFNHDGQPPNTPACTAMLFNQDDDSMGSSRQFGLEYN